MLVAPSVLMVKGAVYMFHVLPLFREYVVEAIPLWVSVAERVTNILLVYQLFIPRVPVVVAVVVGARVSGVIIGRVVTPLSCGERFTSVIPSPLRSMASVPVAVED